MRQRLALEILHDQVGRALVFADVVQRADVRMIERGDCARFAVEALAELWIARELRAENLDRDGSVEPRIARPINFAHPARAEGSLNLVRAESNAWLEKQAVVPPL